MTSETTAWPYHPDLLATPVPRYTSYPTAAEFDELEADTHRAALESAQGDVSLYVHIPFCEKICYYCGCNTSRSGKKQRLDSYLTALHDEISLIASLLPRGTSVRRISFGGGSPNAIEPQQFLALYDTLIVQFGCVDPIASIELDPRTMTADWAEAIATAKIERASMGVQTFASHCQEAIGRIQPEDEVAQSMDWLREAGVSSVNFDLMYGLPGQSRDDLLDTLHRTRVLGADRIALFGYAHVPHIVPRQKVIDAETLPDQTERFAMAGLGHAYLCTHGYAPIGFDHFAKPGGDPLAHAALSGNLRRNFQGFTDDDAPNLIGLGCSSISSFPDLLVQNEKNSGRYRMLASEGLLTTSRGIPVNDADKRYGRIIEQLLCRGRARLTPDVQSEARDALAPFLERDLVSLEEDFLIIREDGLPYSRTIAAIFDPYRQQSARRFSSAV